MTFTGAALLWLPSAGYHVFHSLHRPAATSLLHHGTFTFRKMLLMVVRLTRRAFFPLFFWLLTLQQAYSHGGTFARRLQQHQFDRISIGVRVLMAFFFYVRVLKRHLYRVPNQTGHAKN